MHKIYEASGFKSIRINFPFNKKDKREHTSLQQIKRIRKKKSAHRTKRRNVQKWWNIYL